MIRGTRMLTNCENSRNDRNTRPFFSFRYIEQSSYFTELRASDTEMKCEQNMNIEEKIRTQAPFFPFGV